MATCIGGARRQGLEAIAARAGSQGKLGGLVENPNIHHTINLMSIWGSKPGARSHAREGWKPRKQGGLVKTHPAIHHTINLMSIVGGSPDNPTTRLPCISELDTANTIPIYKPPKFTHPLCKPTPNYNTHNKVQTHTTPTP